MKDVKIVIGANYGDEGKGLVTRYFAATAKNTGLKPIVVFHNGTAQRGHTVDYNSTFRHVYHHFGSGTGDRVPTFFADTFYIHPMEFRREYAELIRQNIPPPTAYYSPFAKVITPLDMAVDHMTEEWITVKNGQREYGSCGFGSWCGIEDNTANEFTTQDYCNATQNPLFYDYIMEQNWNKCLAVLASRKVDIEQTKLAKLATDRRILEQNFLDDLKFFFQHAIPATFNSIYNCFDSLIFENGQGLGLDKNVNSKWHTTSNTGILNPYSMLKDKENFSAEVCYVSRSYLTRHGIGELEESTEKEQINKDMVDRTNVPNDFQGALRYGYLEDTAQKDRISKDFSNVQADHRFSKAMAITHMNEFDCGNDSTKYFSDNPFTITQRK